MNNTSLKWVIIGSLLVLVLAAAGLATYVWTNSALKGKTTTSTPKSTTKEIKVNTSKVESTTTVTVPATAVDESGEIDLSKLR